MGEAKTPHFYGFWIFEPVTKPKKQLFLSLQTPGWLKVSRKFPGTISKHIMFVNLGMLTIYFLQFAKRQAPTNDEDPRKQIFKILDMSSISIKNIKYKFNKIWKTHKTINTKPHNYKIVKP